MGYQNTALPTITVIVTDSYEWPSSIALLKHLL